MTRRRIVPAIASAAAITAAAVAWWVLTKRDPDTNIGVDAKTQTDVPKRCKVDNIIENLKSDKTICYNVMYTAALYTTNSVHLSLETWTQASMRDRITLREWHKLKGRHNMMLRALKVWSICTRRIVQRL